MLERDAALAAEVRDAEVRDDVLGIRHRDRLLLEFWPPYSYGPPWPAASRVRTGLLVEVLAKEAY